MIEDLLQITIWSMREVERFFTDSQIQNAHDCTICWAAVAADCRQIHLEWHQKSRV